MSWVPLHVHSQYSILDSTLSVTTLCERAKELKCSALALTDFGNLFGAVEFYKAAVGVGIKPIIGCEMMLAMPSRHEKKRMGHQPTSFPLILIAKTNKGYQNLCKLSSIGYLEGFYYTPRIDKEVLEKYSEGLICLSGPLSGKIPSLILKGADEELQKEIDWYQRLFKEDFYFEIQRHVMKEADIEKELAAESWLYQNYLDFIRDQESVIERLKELSKRYGIPLVATHDIHYLDREDWRAHEILMNIQTGEPCEIWERDSFGQPKVKIMNPKRRALPSHEHYFKSGEEMRSLFPDLLDAVEITKTIAEKCTLEMDFKTKYYPIFIPKGLEGKSVTKEERMEAAAQFLRTLCEEGIKKRYTQERLAKVSEKYPGRDPLDVVMERLKLELDLIISKGMCDYLLIVHDFIDWAKKNGIPMGPGRGSGVGSIVLYLIEVTDIEPLRFNLFFERFINPERLSYPDIDVDICMERRSEVIDYVVQKYGKEKVAQIITFGTMKAKMAIKDVGRVLGVPLSKVNQIAKLIPEELNITLDKALEVDFELRKLYESDDEVQKILDLGRKLEGSIRNTGVHAAGLIISGEPISEHIPVCMAKDSVVTQYSMKPVEAVGMLKIDFLGLKTLTSIQKAVRSIKASYGVDIDWINLPLDDKATFSLLNQGKTLGLFQLESGGMQELARQLHIDKFEEIIAVGSLYRPGPMEMIPSFINRKHGKEAIEIDHPLMKDILAETYGIMVYQEQVMQIASLLADYTLGEGDVLRRAMGKKDREEMAKQREKFKRGALKNGIDEDTSMRIFDKVEKFASYGFNKSHAAAYGYLTYVTAYLKANYPGHWMAALMTCDHDDVTKVARFIAECQTMGIAILPPDINEAEKEFNATPKGIRFAMQAIKGIGEGVVEAIIEERAKGAFQSLYDFIKRIDSKRVGKKAIEILIEAGAFDFIGWTREQLFLMVEPIMETTQRVQKDEAAGILHLFSMLDDQEEKRLLAPPEIRDPIPEQKILRREKELLGFYLTGHPMNAYRDVMQQLSCVPLDQLDQFEHDAVIRAAFIIEEVQTKISTKNQKKFAILTISDGSIRFELPIWAELYEEKSPLIVENQLIYAVLQIDKKEEEIKLHCRWFDDLTQAGESMINTCDAAFEKAKNFVTKSSSFRDRSMSRNKEQKKKETGKLSITLEMEKLRLSHILEIKKIFRHHSGNMPVELSFQSEAQTIGVIHIDAAWGIQYEKALEQKLSSIASIRQVLHQL